MSRPSFDLVLARIPSGIYILTLGGSQPTGMLASWVMQAGFDPPMLSVAVKTERYIAERLTAGEAFALNVLAEGQKHTLRHFGRGFEPGEAAFEGVTHTLSSAGIPLLAECVGHLECKPHSQAQSGDHTIVIAQVTAGEFVADHPPMVHIRKTSTHY